MSNSDHDHDRTPRGVIRPRKPDTPPDGTPVIHGDVFYDSSPTTDRAKRGRFSGARDAPSSTPPLLLDPQNPPQTRSSADEPVYIQANKVPLTASRAWLGLKSIKKLSKSAADALNELLNRDLYEKDLHDIERVRNLASMFLRTSMGILQDAGYRAHSYTKAGVGTAETGSALPAAATSPASIHLSTILPDSAPPEDTSHSTGPAKDTTQTTTSTKTGKTARGTTKRRRAPYRDSAPTTAATTSGHCPAQMAHMATPSTRLVVRYPHGPLTPDFPRPHPAVLRDSLNHALNAHQVASIQFTKTAQLIIHTVTPCTAEQLAQRADVIWPVIQDAFGLHEESARPQFEPDSAWSKIVLHDVPLPPRSFPDTDIFALEEKVIHDLCSSNFIPRDQVRQMRWLCSEEEVTRRASTSAIRRPTFATIMVALYRRDIAETLRKQGAHLLGGYCRVSNYRARLRAWTRQNAQ